MGQSFALAGWLCLALASQSAQAEGPRPVLLQGSDILTLPNQPVRLEGWLCTDGDSVLGWSIGEEEVYFYLGNDRLGIERTDVQGIAGLRRFAPESGDYSIRLVYPGSERYRETEGSLRLFVRPPAARFLVTEIDAVLARSDSAFMFRETGEALRSVTWASSVLRQLAAQSEYTILYLTSRDRSIEGMTRDWLERRGFPPGPLFCWNMFESPLSPQDYKAKVLRSIQSQWSDLAWAVAGCLSDVEVCRAAGIQPIWYAPSRPEALPPDVPWESDWRTIGARIVKRPVVPDKSRPE